MSRTHAAHFIGILWSIASPSFVLFEMQICKAFRVEIISVQCSHFVVRNVQMCDTEQQRLNVKMNVFMNEFSCLFYFERVDE